MKSEELYLPPTPKHETPPVDAVRGFVFLSGARWMQRRGLLDAYQGLLPEEHRARLQTMTASEWIPLAQALIAYRACDALALSVEEQIDLGHEVARANNNVVIQTLLKLLGRMGATPWLALKHLDKAWSRSNRGGAVAVYKEGERTARLEFWSCPLAVSPFFVTSMRGAIGAGLEPFCERCSISAMPERVAANEFALRMTWV